MAEYIAIFIFFFAVIDPIGTVPVYIAVTVPFSQKENIIKCSCVSLSLVQFPLEEKVYRIEECCKDRRML